MRIVLKIGGSIVASPINSKLISSYISLLKRLRLQRHEIAVVVGGGALAREFIGAARNMGLDERAQDEIAISVSRIFAKLFLMKLDKVGCRQLPTSIEDTIRCVEKGKIAVMGGLKPGMTTDTVAALIAERFRADMLVKATDQEGVYDKDPKKYSDAVKLDHLSLEHLQEKSIEYRHKAGIHQILDLEAAKILRRNRLKTVIVNGTRLENVTKAIKGENVGTLID
jgi:uridylate kinase